MDTAQWWDFSKSLPENLPDSAYDALREQFFKAKVMPEVMQQGFNISAAEREWKDATERPGKKGKAAVLGEIAGKASIKGLVAPVVGLSGSPELQQSYAQLGQGAEAEATRQEISPALTMGADLAGTAAGMAPYFVSPVSGARALGARLADKFAARALTSGAQVPTWAGKRALQTAMEMGVTAPIQGMYDAARTTDGHRMLEGFKGAAIGAGAVGVVEGLGVGLRGLLRSSHGLDAAQAEAVEAVARGVGDDAQGALAANVMQAQPDIQQSVAGWLSEGVKRAKKLGGSLEGLQIEDGGMLHLHMKGADGKPYWLTRLDTSSVDKSVERIAKHLEKGGEILSVKGDPALINKMYLQFENFFKKEYELPTPLKGGDSSTAHLIPEEAYPNLVKRLPDEIPTGVEPQDVLPEGAAPPPAPPVGTPANLMQLPDGRVVDKANKQIYESMEQALKSQGIQYKAQTKGMDHGGWFGPAGEKIILKPRQLHEHVGREILDPLGIEYIDAVSAMTDLGWVRTRDNGVEFSAEFINKDSVSSAIMDAIDYAKTHGRKTIQVDAFGLAHVTVPINGVNEYELLANPKKYLQLANKGMKFQANKGSLGERFLPEEMVDGLVKEKPLYRSGTLTPEVAQEANGITQLMGKGQKPIILLSKTADNIRDTVFHENIHGHLDYLGIAHNVKQAVANNPKARQLVSALDANIRKLAQQSDDLLEETAAYLTTAIRVGDDSMLKQFVDADGSLEEVLQTGIEVAQSIKAAALQGPPSLHRQTLLRKMTDVERRAGGITHLRDEFDKLGRELEIENGKFTTVDNGKKLTFNSRQEVESYIEQNLLEPLNAPDLWDELFLPNMPKFAARANPKQVPPLTTTPIPPSGPPAGRLKGGVHALSFFFRPFYPWLETVSRKNNWPELYDKFKQLDFGIGEVDKITNTFEKKFVKVFDKLPHSKRHDLYTYFETPDAKKPEMAKTLKLGQKDLDLVERINIEIINPISSETGHSLNTFIQEFMPAVRQLKGDVDAVKPTKTMSQTDVDFYKQIARGGSIDARDTDLLRVLVNYTRDGSQRKVLGTQLDDLDSFINKKNDDGQFVLGSLQPLFRRHLEHIKGNPDRTQYMLNGAMETTIDSLNQAIDGVNKKLPKNKQLEKIELPAEEVMGRFMLFSYAGTLGLRPMTLLRDGMQVITTTYPMLGGTYFKRGMEKAFPAIKGGKQSNPWQVADKYGALMDRADLTNLYSGGQGVNIATTAATKISEQMLHGLQWTNNANRLISFWGHSERMMDSIKKYRHDPKLFAKKSGLIYLDAPLQEKFVKELAEMDSSEWQDLAHRAAKELTDVSQWSYRRGAQPGAYKFALGRLMGQYGTWPANYVEYGRRIMRSGDGIDKLQTGVRLAAAHYAVLKGGEAHGVDTSTWVFNSPMAYQGGPLLTGAMALPQALGDSQTRMGDQARDRLYRIPQVSVPGGLAMSRVYDSIVKDEPDKWKIILGFDPLSESEMKEGMHNLP